MSEKRLVILIAGIGLAGIVSACSAAAPLATQAPTEPPTEAASPAPTDEPAEPAGQTVITFGDIGSDPSVIIEGTQPIADYVAEELAGQGITKGQVKVAKDTDQMTQWLKDGEVDVYFDSVYPAWLIGEASGAKPFIRRWKGGVEEYHTVIFAAKSSGITKVEDLAGHVIGFDTPYSTSGYVLPLAYLTEAGLTLVEKENAADTVDKNEVGYTFSQADQNTVQWVVSGKLAAAATDSVTYGKLDDDVKSQLVIVAETESLPRGIGLLRAGIDEKLAAALTEVLLNADKDDAGKAALDSFQGTVKFDEFPQGIDRALARVQELVDIVNASKKK